MKELLIEMLREYQEKFNQNKKEVLEMMKNNAPESEWQEHAKKGAGLKQMIEATIIELTKWE